MDVEDLCRMMLTRRGRRPKLRFCFKRSRMYYIFLSFRIQTPPSSIIGNGGGSSGRSEELSGRGREVCGRDCLRSVRSVRGC